MKYIGESRFENNLTIGGSLTVGTNLTVSGTTTTVNSTTLTIDDKNIELAHSPSGSAGNDSAVDGGGITLISSDSNKTLNWVNSTDSWTSSENIDIASGKTFKVAGTTVLTGSALGSGITGSSLTSVGTIATGTWAANDIAVAHGGTGSSNATDARTALGAQASDADLTAIAGLTNSDGNFIVGSASGWVAESGATARTSLGLGTMAVAATSDYAALAGATFTGAVNITDTTAPLVLKYDAQEFVTHAISSAGVYSIATTDDSNDTGAITLDTVDKITLDSDTADQGIVYADGATELMSITNSSSDVIFKPLVDAKDIIIQQYDGNEVARFADNRRLYLYDEGGEYLSSSGSALTIASGGVAWELPTADGSANQVLKTDGSGNLDWVDSGGGGAYSDWRIESDSYAASSGDQIITTKATANTVTLPSSPSIGNTVTIKVVGAGTVTVARNSSKINSATEDGTIYTDNAVQLVYVSASIGWASI